MGFSGWAPYRSLSPAVFERRWKGSVWQTHLYLLSQPSSSSPFSTKVTQPFSTLPREPNLQTKIVSAQKQLLSLLGEGTIGASPPACLTGLQVVSCCGLAQMPMQIAVLALPFGSFLHWSMPRVLKPHWLHRCDILSCSALYNQLLGYKAFVGDYKADVDTKYWRFGG